MDGEKRRFGFWNSIPTRHTPLEDVQGIFASSMIAALGLALMGSAGLVASGTAGVAFVLHYLAGSSPFPSRTAGRAMRPCCAPRCAMPIPRPSSAGR